MGNRKKAIFIIIINDKILMSISCKKIENLKYVSMGPKNPSCSTGRQ